MDLADHPGLQHLAELLEIGLIEQIREGGIQGPASVLKPQRLVKASRCRRENRSV